MVTTESVLPRRGRKLDRARDSEILDAALDVLAERGFDGTTIDLVAARARAGKSTLYRRWASKTDLVLEALRRLDTEQIELGDLPDTGSLRADLLSMLQPRTDEQDRRRIGIMNDLASLSRREPLIAERAVQAAIDPWVEATRLLIVRAIDRGEYPPADAALLASVVPTIVAYHQAVRGRPVSDDDFVRLIDHVLLAALRSGR